MDLRIVYENEAGNLSVVIPSGEVSIDEVLSKDVPKNSTPHVTSASNLPPYGHFFNAWVFSTPPEVVVDIAKAQGIYKQTADSTAASLSQPLTQEYMRLMAIGADTTAVQAQLQAINAAAEETAYLDATTVDELVACWPPELGPNPFLPASNEVA